MTGTGLNKKGRPIVWVNTMYMVSRGSTTRGRSRLVAETKERAGRIMERNRVMTV